MQHLKKENCNNKKRKRRAFPGGGGQEAPRTDLPQAKILIKRWLMVWIFLQNLLKPKQILPNVYFYVQEQWLNPPVNFNFQNGTSWEKLLVRERSLLTEFSLSRLHFPSIRQFRGLNSVLQFCFLFNCIKQFNPWSSDYPQEPLNHLTAYPPTPSTPRTVASGTQPNASPREESDRL